MKVGGIKRGQNIEIIVIEDKPFNDFEPILTSK